MKHNEIEINNANYEESKQAKSFFKFVGKSKKIALISTEFDGYVKKGTLSFARNKNYIENIQLSFHVVDLDTDSAGRNQKLHEYCLDYKRFPSLLVTIVDPIDLERSNQVVKAFLHIKDRKIPVRFSIERIDEAVFVGNAEFKLSDAGIPDPSILVASVNDVFKLYFRIKL